MPKLTTRQVLLTVFCVANLISPAVAIAQNGNPLQTNQKTPFQPVSLEPNNLPYIASVAPPGGKLFCAMKSTKARNGRMTLILRYGCSDTAANTMRHYAETLQKAKWIITTQNEKQLVAAYKNYSFAATAYGPSEPGSRGDIQIIYQLPTDDQ